MRYLFFLALLVIFFDNFFLQSFEVTYFVFKLVYVVIQLIYFFINLTSSCLCHKLVSHSVSDGTIVQVLIGCQLLSEFISYSHQQETSFGTVDCDLSDQFIKALLKQSLSYWTNTHVSCLSLLQSFVKKLLQKNNIHSGGGCR